MTTNNQHIIDLCNQLVTAVRQDIRKELLNKLRDEFGTGETDQPLQKTRGQRGKDKRPFRPHSSLGRIYRVLASRKHGININTLARESGLTLRGVQNSIHRLRRHGYQIECNRIGYRKPKYKLAS